MTLEEAVAEALGAYTHYISANRAWMEASMDYDDYDGARQDAVIAIAAALRAAVNEPRKAKRELR